MKKKILLAVMACLSLLLISTKTTLADTTSEQIKKSKTLVFLKSVLNKMFQTLVIIQLRAENTKVWKLI